MITLAGVGQGSVKNPLGANQFVSTWNPSLTSTGSSTATQVKLPLVSTGTYNFVVDWGDGTNNTITTWNQAQVTHTYSTSKLYQIKITGTCYGWQFNATGDRLKLLSVQQWGNAFRLGNATGYFSGCENLELQQVGDVLDLTGTTTFLNMFSSCFKLTSVKNINLWVTTNVTIMTNAFVNAYNFDDNIGAWNVANVTDMSGMFNVSVAISVGRGRFNNGGSDTIKNWNTSNVTTLQTTFQNQIKFNQEVGLWNINKVTSLFGTFAVSSTSGIFNNAGSSSIGSWNTSLVTNMRSTFSNQPYFNRNLGLWNTANVTTMQAMFNSNYIDGIFNNDGSDTIKNWNTSKVTTMLQMFTGQPYFNQPIGSWNTGLVVDMSYLFYSYYIDSPTRIAGTFNADISSWNVANVTNIVGLLAKQTSFNQPLNTWNTVKVTNMGDVFDKAYAFNQSISNWKVNLVTTFSDGNGFMAGKTYLDYSSANYDALLIGWASRPVLANKSINFGTIKYTSASVSARAVLTSAPNNWTIIDGGLV